MGQHKHRPVTPPQPVKKYKGTKDRFVKAVVAPTGVHSILDVFVLSDLTLKVREGAVVMITMVTVWYVGRTLLAFIATYFEEA